MLSSARRLRFMMIGSLLLLAWTASAAASETLQNISPRPHGAPPGTSLMELAAAIRDAANDDRWVVLDEAPGEMTVSIWVRERHRAIVRIGYDASDFWIDYVDSENLDYSEKDRVLPKPSKRVIKGPRIHKNYNRWVDNLASRIATRAKKPPRVEPVVDPLLRVADELEKLDALRERGVLTQDEFDQQKTKLLGSTR